MEIVCVDFVFTCPKLEASACLVIHLSCTVCWNPSKRLSDIISMTQAYRTFPYGYKKYYDFGSIYYFFSQCYKATIYLDLLKYQLSDEFTKLLDLVT